MDWRIAFAPITGVEPVSPVADPGVLASTHKFLCVKIQVLSPARGGLLKALTPEI